MLEDILEPIALSFLDAFGSLFNKRSWKEIVLALIFIFIVISLVIYYFKK